METKKQLPKILYRNFFILMILFVSFHLDAQDKELIISDGANLIISENTFIKIPGNITLGEGISGKLVMRGNTFDATGQLDINAGSDLDITNGTFTVSTTNFSNESTVTYDGTDQEIKNWEYGHLVLNGNGQMSVLGDAATPTICKTLTVNNTGNVLNVPEKKAITIENTLTNNASVDGILIASSATGDGSLISYTVDVNATVNRYITGERWHYLSPPIDAAPLTLFNTNNFLWWDAAMEWNGLGDYGPWKGYTDENLINGQGYAYYYYEDTIGFQGSMNVSNYTQTLYKSSTGDADYQGWNLVGNPYTSILDWDAAVADGAVPVGAENAIYFFDDETGDGEQSNYRYYVPSTGGTYGIGTKNATGAIPLGQAFFIKTNTDNVTLNLKKDYRKHAAQEFYKSNNGDLILLEISNGIISDESIVRIVENSTFSFDAEYDAHKMFPGDETIPQLYSIDIDEVLTAINSIPEIKKDTEIKLGVKALEGDYDINLTELNFFDYDVYLVDNYFNTYTNLTEEETYEFSHYGGQIENRFYLTFQSQGTNIDNYPTSYINIYPNPTNSYIKFNNTGDSKFESITINSVNGKICYKNNEAEHINNIDLSKFSNGVYFIQINLANGKTYHNRIILQK